MLSTTTVKDLKIKWLISGDLSPGLNWANQGTGKMTVLLTNQTVIDLCQGDPGAFRAIYEKFYGQLYSFTVKFLNNKEDAEDVLHDIFSKLWRDRATFDEIKNIEAYLHIMIRNACLDFLRRAALVSRIQRNLLYEMENEEEYHFRLAEIKGEVIQFVKMEIEQLPIKYKDVFRMAFMEGFSNAEIASALGLKNQDVASIKYITVKLIRIRFFHKGLLITAFFSLVLKG